MATDPLSADVRSGCRVPREPVVPCGFRLEVRMRDLVSVLVDQPRFYERGRHLPVSAINPVRDFRFGLPGQLASADVARKGLDVVGLGHSTTLANASATGILNFGDTHG